MQEYTIETLRQGILSNSIEEKRATTRAFKQLAKDNHSQFLDMCYTLLQDPEIRVQFKVFGMLGWHGDRDDPIAEAAARKALSNPELRGRALLALGTVGTSATVPLLFEEAERDLKQPERERRVKIALESLAKQARTEEDRRKALRLSREALLSEHYPLRDVALRALKILSTAADEEDLLLQAYRMYHDELVVWALGAASPHMLLILYELLAAVEPQYAEHKDIARAIDRIKIRMEQGEEADPGKRHCLLSEYL
jgi:hypothetical protein